MRGLRPEWGLGVDAGPRYYAPVDKLYTREARTSDAIP